MTINREAKTPNGFTDTIRSQVISGNINGARAFCKETDTPVARMIEKGLSRIGSPLKNIEVSIENEFKPLVWANAQFGNQVPDADLYKRSEFNMLKPLLSDGTVPIVWGSSHSFNILWIAPHARMENDNHRDS